MSYDSVEADDGDALESAIMQEETVQRAVKSLPKKNVSLTKKDKGAILNLFDVTKKEVDLKVTSKIDNITTTITKTILSKIPFYRQIKKKNIRSWYRRRLKKIQKSGKKINEEFESQFGVTYYSVYLRTKMKKTQNR